MTKQVILINTYGDGSPIETKAGEYNVGLRTIEQGLRDEGFDNTVLVPRETIPPQDFLDSVNGLKKKCWLN